MAVASAGELRHRIALERLAGELDAAGELVAQWLRYAQDLPAKYESRGGSEVNRAEQRSAVQQADFTVRYREDVQPEDRLVWGARQFEITSAHDATGRRRWLEISVTELR